MLTDPIQHYVVGLGVPGIDTSQPQSMPDSFFTSNKPRKRKRTEPSSLSSSSKSKKTRHTPNAGSKTTKSKRLDEDLDSDQTSDAGDDDDLRVPSDVEGEVEGEDDPNETPAEKRLRLAQLYLDGVKEDLAATQGDIDAAEIDKELISSRLRGAQYRGKVHLFVAEEFAEASCSQLRVKGHRLSCTAAVASPVASSSGYHLFTAGKEGHIFKWDLQNGKQIAAMYKVKPEKGKGKGKAYPAPTAGHTSSVTSLALTTDGSYLASGAMDSRAGLWDARVCRWITGFSHKDTVSSLSFRTNTNSASASSSAHTLYTASFDRTVKLWTLPPAAPLTSLSSSDPKQSHAPPQNMGYIETLFGHQDQILALDCLPSLPTLPPISSASFTTRPISSLPTENSASASAPAKVFGYSRHPLTTPAETLLTVGARDKTARFWKVPEETQLVFRGGGATSSAQEIRTKRDKLRDVLEGKMDALASDDEELDDETGKGKGRRKNENEQHRYIEGSIESVAMIDENTFLTGGDSGSICLWSTSKKKPIFTCGVAHGVYDPFEKEGAGENEDGKEDEIKIPPHPRWITALESLRYSNLFASGSYDGAIRLWKLTSSSKKNTENQLSSFTLLSTIPCAGVINSLQFITPEEGFWPGSEWAFADRRLLSSRKPRQTSESDAAGSRKRNADARPILLIASIGQEHRFGRWVGVKQQIIEVPSSLPDQDGEVPMSGGEADSFRSDDVQMKQVAVRNGAIVFALFPRGWVK